MAIARHGSGPHAELAALASQVHPVFMLPPVATALFGGLLAAREVGGFAPTVAGVHVVAIFLAVYTAHVKDGYVDFHHRGEDDDHPITAPGCRALLFGSSVGFFAALLGLRWLVGIETALLTLPTWLIAYNHAPRLDTDPIGATAGYPLGIAIAILSGYHAQAGFLSPVALGFALVFLVLLSGVKVIDDAQDYDYDRSIEKRTVAVVLGPRKARRVAYGLVGAALFGVLGFVALGLFPAGAAFAPAVFVAVAATTRRATPELATMLLVRGSYLFLAVLVIAVWYEPLA